MEWVEVHAANAIFSRRNLCISNIYPYNKNTCLIRNSRIAYTPMKPQDVIVALSMLTPDMPASYAERGKSLGISASEVHAAERRLSAARLLEPQSKVINKEALIKFLVHGVPYAFAVSPAEITRGVPTAWAAPVLRKRFALSNQIPPVWPDPTGNVQGTAVQPLYRSASQIAKSNPKLYAMLALADALRIGRARERKLAEEELRQLLDSHAAA